jgi:uncharacterized protein YjbI with pentapeptide repeats
LKSEIKKCENEYPKNKIAMKSEEKENLKMNTEAIDGKPQANEEIYYALTCLEFFEAFEKGHRKFNDLEFEELDGFSNKDFSGVEFTGCFFALDFRNSNLSKSKFVRCNVKTSDFRQANLTNALMKNCSIESAMFEGAITDGFQFIENYCYGCVLDQEDFERSLI